MSNAIRAAIEELRMHIRKLEEEVIQNKLTVNSLCRRIDEAPVYADADLQKSPDLSQIRADTFYGQPLNTAIRKYLEMRRAAGLGPGKVRDIYEGIIRGGYQFDTKNEANSMRSLRMTLAKSTHTFHKLPGGEYGLLSWYPGAKVGNSTKPDDEDQPEPDDGSKPKVPDATEGSA